MTNTIKYMSESPRIPFLLKKMQHQGERLPCWLSICWPYAIVTGLCMFSCAVSYGYVPRSCMSAFTECIQRLSISFQALRATLMHQDNLQDRHILRSRNTKKNEQHHTRVGVWGWRYSDGLPQEMVHELIILPQH
jgi:hypothetical protein